MATYPFVRLEEERRRLEADGVPVIDFGKGDPNEPTDPRIRQALIENLTERSSYPLAQGLPELRAAIARWCSRRFGVALDPDTEIVPTLGSKEAIFSLAQVLVDPPATARYGSFLSPGVVMMPSYVNIGAWVGPRTMVDTWATVGSCAQIGADVHLSGGVGIGGLLEPPQARPVIVEDGAFVGSRAIVVEGVIVREQAVIAPNVVLSASVPIIDVTGSKPVEYRGEVPARAVVLPGVREKD